VNFTKNLSEDASTFQELVTLVQGRSITSAADIGASFELGLSGDYMLRIDGSRVNIVRTKEPPEDI